jgi:ADP-ribose pyrophosphatase YjhB (NUDIX family)
MTKICDHTSVGMLVRNEEKILLIERARFPFGYAIPAGHVDGDKSFEEAAKRELKEEVGLEPISMQKIYEGRRENPCRREGGSWHLWKIYEVTTEGEVDRSVDETKRANWFTKEEISKLSTRTKEYLEREIPEDEWEKNPGLEPIMYEFFKELKIIK